MQTIVTFLKSIAVAFSIYSVIPMPRFTWKSEDMQYHLIFFPWVGAVIGIAEALWLWASQKIGFGSAAWGAVAAAIPLLLTGGFHLDGYLDTMDAIHSYQSREEKLRIMSDPHIGAFAVVWGGIWMLLFFAGASELTWSDPASEGIAAAWCMSFFLSRGFSGFGVITIPSAKKDGMLQTFAGTAQRKMVWSALIIELCICAALMGLIGGIPGLILAVICAACFAIYRSWSIRTFDGITGDLAGFYVCTAELLMTLAAGIMTVFVT